MKNRARIVIGANFGDEGKGLVTDWLCAQGAGVVVRFCGGAQAGHTVVLPDGRRHVFHHFGSGTLAGVPTFLSQFFVCNPVLFFPELKKLEALGVKPVVFAHPDCLVTTYADMLINQRIEAKRAGGRHGSCGVGFHETMNRSNIAALKITMSDLWNGGKQLEAQLAEICGKYAAFRTGETIDDDRAVEAFLACCNAFAEYVQPAGIGQCRDPVFEGSQGLLLDQGNKEFFPHVTHANTGMTNVRVLLEQGGYDSWDNYYVSRTYLTRHGAGKLPGEDPALSYPDNTNEPNPWQGSLRFAPLTLLELGKLYNRCEDDAGGNYRLVFTHCDQVAAPDGEYDLVSHGPTREHVTNDPTALSIRVV